MSFWSDVSDFFSGAAKAVGEAIDFVGQTVAGIIGGVGDVIDATFDFAGATVESGATFVGKVVGSTFDIITGQYGKQNTIGQTIENAITTVGQLAGGLLDGVGELIGGTFNHIADAISYTSENVGEALGADLVEINASFDSFRRNIHRTLDRFEGDINPVSQETLGSGTPVAIDAEKSNVIRELEDLFFQENISSEDIEKYFDDIEKGNIAPNEILEDFDFISSYSSPGEIELHGFEAIVMENKLTGDVVVAIGGTQSFDDIGDPDFTLDAITDMALGGPQVDTDAFNQAIATAVDKARVNGTSITFTGNSLGGALSEHAAYETAKSYADLRGRINSVSFDGFGAADSITIREGSLDSDVIDGINARYYYSPDDKIARIGNHLGTGFAVERATNVDAQRTYTKAFGAHGDNLGQFATAIDEYFAGNADELYQQRVDVNSAATGLGRVGIPLHQVLHAAVSGYWDSSTEPTIVGQNDEGEFQGSDGEDMIVYDGHSALNGGGGFDSVMTLSSDNIVVDMADAQIEAITGGSGNDQISASSATASVFMNGDKGNDTLTGSASRDVLYGGYGDDELYGGLGNDELSGDGDDDTVHGEAGNDHLAGGAGNDHLFGEAGNDSLLGGRDNDELDGGSGDNRYNFQRGDGHDTILAQSGGIHRLYFEESVSINDIWLQRLDDNGNLSSSGDDLKILVLGEDQSVTIKDYFSTSATVADFDIRAAGGLVRLVEPTIASLVPAMAAVTQPTGGNGSPYIIDDTVFISVENDLNAAWISSSFYGDQQLHNGDDGVQNWNPTDDKDDETLKSYGGDDIINAKDGEDLILGGSGDDDIDGGSQQDLIFGGTGDDTIDGGSNSDIIHGDQGNDTISGGSESDRLYGGDGNDTLYGNAGNDALNGGGGDDTLYGGAGDDTYIFQGQFGDDRVIEDATGLDTVIFEDATRNDIRIYRSVLSNETSDGTYTTQDIQYSRDLFIVVDNAGWVRIKDYFADTLSNEFNPLGVVENIAFDGGSTTAQLIKDTLDELGSGTILEIKVDGDDASLGKAEIDHIIKGTDSDDQLTGTSERDELIGTDGDDVLNGGEGNDVLRGGAGDDDYIFTGQFGDDIVIDEQGGGGNWDMVKFADATPDKIEFYRQGLDLRITVAGQGSVVIRNHFASTDSAAPDGESGIEKFEYAGGWTRDSRLQEAFNTYGLDARLTPSGTGDNVTLDEVVVSAPETGTGDGDEGTGSGTSSGLGTTTLNEMTGTAGDDTLTSTSADDRLIGGAGSDYYVFQGDFGNDEVVDESGGWDRLKFVGFAKEDLRFAKSGRDLVVTADDGAGNGGTVTVKDHYVDGAIGMDTGGIEKFEYTGSGGWSTAEKLRQAMASFGASQAETTDFYVIDNQTPANMTHAQT